MWSSQPCSSIGNISQGKIAGAAVSFPCICNRNVFPCWSPFDIFWNHVFMLVAGDIELHGISFSSYSVWFMNYMNCRDSVVPLIVKSVKNPRSAVCKTALMTCADIFKAYGDLMVDSIDLLVCIAIQMCYLVFLCKLLSFWKHLFLSNVFTVSAIVSKSFTR